MVPPIAPANNALIDLFQTRRLKYVDRKWAVMVDRIGDIWGTRTPFARGENWPVRVDQKLADGIRPDDVDRWVQSACTLCSNGCACDIAVKDDQMVGVRGRAMDIVNHGRLGPKGLFASAASWSRQTGRRRWLALSNAAQRSWPRRVR
jgi:hypothetical protein